jgi:pheromone shutdown protein TraB
MRVTLLGTGHVFAIAQQVRTAVLDRAPAVVCLELDPNRLAALRQREADKKAGRPAKQATRKDAPFAYRLLARFQERIADSYDVDVGGEMVAAVDAAQQLNVPIACIDVDSILLIRRVWKEMPWSERMRLFGAMAQGVFTRKKGVEDEVASFEKDPASYLHMVGAQFPTAKRVLIDERDQHMALGILRAAQVKGDVVAVVGDGHVGGIEEQLRKVPGLDLEVIRLKHLRDGKVPAAAPKAQPFSVSAGPAGGARASFTTEWRSYND